MGSDSCDKFHHPYEPYDIQLQLMRCIYNLLNDGKKFAILESPTGTGKTLSLICAILTWLRDNKIKFIFQEDSNIKNDMGAYPDSVTDTDTDDEPDWVNDAYRASSLESKLKEINDYEEHLSKFKPAKLEDYGTPKTKRQRVEHVKIAIDANQGGEEEFLPDDFDEVEKPKSFDKKADKLRNEVSALLANLEPKNGASGMDNVEHSLNPVKFFFASRTYSQLNQFASQLHLAKFPSSFEKYDIPEERIKYLPLGSRKQYCINPSVKKLGSVDLINDACLDLLKKDGKKCQFYKSASTNESKTFRDNVFYNISDIEDIVKIGEKLKVCPFYGTKNSLLNAEVVTLPYQYLLSENTRQSLSIDLSNSIVVIDEAHNLLETINSIYSAEVSVEQLKICENNLNVYLGRFRKRLNSVNRVNLLKLIKLLNVLTEFIHKNYKKAGEKIDANFLSSLSNADNLNVHKVNNYIKKSKIAFKIDSFIQTEELKKSDDSGDGTRRSSQPLLFQVASFISCLSNPSNEGQFFFDKKGTIKYMLLESGNAFQSVLDVARCVILAGGTMQPVSDILDNLTKKLPEDKTEVFSCNHIIPDQNLVTFIMPDSRFEFTFENREKESLIQHLYDFYFKLSTSVPTNGGIVGFFPSYQYLSFVIKAWRRMELFDKLRAKREIFFESKNGIDPLPSYTEYISEGRGAILLAVVGGKLSEGINFENNLCRAVVMTGLPFPNVFSGELLIKKKHLENRIINSGGTQSDANLAVKNFYETICMKAVNQSIGRAIRHANDYALIYLLDGRYDNVNIKSKLSNWVAQRIRHQSTVDECMNSTRSFFSQK